MGVSVLGREKGERKRDLRHARGEAGQDDEFSSDFNVDAPDYDEREDDEGKIGEDVEDAKGVPEGDLCRMVSVCDSKMQTFERKGDILDRCICCQESSMDSVAGTGKPRRVLKPRPRWLLSVLEPERNFCGVPRGLLIEGGTGRRVWQNTSSE